MNWDDLRFLMALRRHRTMSATARALGTNVATVSRRLDRFTAQTGRPGFVRSTEGWVALPHMHDLLDRCESFEAELHRALACPDTKPETLTIGAPPFVTRTFLIPALPHLAGVAGDIGVHFQDRIHEDGLGTCDLVLRGTRPDQGRVIAPRIGRMTFGLYAHRDWTGGDWVGLTPEFDDAPLMCAALSHFQRPPKLRVSQLQHVADLVQDLRSAGPLPDRLATAFADLQPIATGAGPLTGDVWACYHITRKGDPTLKQVLDWVRTALATPEGSDEALAPERSSDNPAPERSGDNPAPAPSGDTPAPAPTPRAATL